MSAHRIEVTTLGDLLLRAADRHGDRDAIIFPDARLTYGQLRERAYERARSLLALGVDRGDHVGILMPNCLDYVECLFAVQLLGAMAVPVNARYKAKHKLTGETFTIKVAPRVPLDDPARKLAMSEISVLQHCNKSKFCVELEDFFEEDENIYLVSKYSSKSH